MNWLKVGAIVVGGIVVYFVVHTVVSLFFGLLSALMFVAIVAGGGYVAYKIAGARRRRQVKDRPEGQRRRREVESRDIVVPPVTPMTSAAPAAPRPAPIDVEDDLARLKREMGH